MATLVREEKYIKSDLRNNNNKFWTAQVYDNGDVTTIYGRVGDSGQTRTKGFASVAAAEKFVDKKIKEKTRDGRNGEIAYRPLNVVEGTEGVKQQVQKVASGNLENLAKKQIKYSNPNVAKLISYLTKVNAHDISKATGGQITFNDTTRLFSTPLGVVTQENIDEANQILVSIGDLVSKNRYAEKMKGLTNDLLMLVPQDIGRNRLDVRNFWSDLTKVQNQKAIVDSLQASLVSASSQPDRKKTIDVPEEQVFDVQLDLVEDGKIIDYITNKYRKTRKNMHACRHLDVKKVYSVDINTVSSAFKDDGAKDNNIWELWHGSRSSNLLSVLKSGLRLPTASSTNVTGAMFSGRPGKEGLYFSDQSSKSLNYSFGAWSGGRDDNCFMFIVDVAMGNYYIPKGPHDGPFPRTGYDSTFAKPGKSGIQNEEMIVYSTSKVNLKYLIEFSPNGK
jgi:poly [ADP-ribose] polymerase 2/3/4